MPRLCRESPLTWTAVPTLWVGVQGGFSPAPLPSGERWGCRFLLFKGYSYKRFIPFRLKVKSQNLYRERPRFARGPRAVVFAFRSALSGASGAGS